MKHIVAVILVITLPPILFVLLVAAPVIGVLLGYLALAVLAVVLVIFCIKESWY